MLATSAVEPFSRAASQQVYVTIANFDRAYAVTAA
jgi:hypothetical protein